MNCPVGGNHSGSGRHPPPSIQCSIRTDVSRRCCTPPMRPRCCAPPMRPRNTAPRSLLYCGDVSRAVRKSKLYTAKVTSNSPVECDYVIGTSVLCWCLLGMCKSGRLGLPLRMGNVQFLTLYWLSGEQVDDVCVGK